MLYINQQKTFYHFAFTLRLLSFAGDFTVTLVVFSGIPDPVWTIASSHEDYMEIQKHLNAAIKNGWADNLEDIPSILGYKGILIEPKTKKKSVILIVRPETVKFQTMLFNTMPEDALTADLRKEISKMIASGVDKHHVATKRNKRYAPPYGGYQMIHPWALLGTQLRNNCYNYATTIRTDTIAWPGRATGLMLYPPVDGLNVGTSAMRDGLIFLNINHGDPAPVNPPLPNQYHAVALVVWPGKCSH